MDEPTATESLSRKQIAIRLLYTLFFVIVLEIVKMVIQLCVLFQYVYLFITTDYSQPVRTFSNKATVYAYRLMRYITLNDNLRPFPFGEFPREIDPPEAEAVFE